MTDTCCDALCVQCDENAEGVWYRDVPDNFPLFGTLNIKIHKTPDLDDRESCIGWHHYLVFHLGNQTIRTPLFNDIVEVRDKVYTMELDGKSHFLKISAHTWTWVPCLANLINGSMELPIHGMLENQGCETQMYYKHRFHKLLDGSLKFEVWLDGDIDGKESVPKGTQLKENPQHPLAAWHRGAYDAIFSAWLQGKVIWVNSFFMDQWIYICNNHLFLGIFLAHHWNPLTHRSRVVVYTVSVMMNVFALGVFFWSQRCLVPDCNQNAWDQGFCVPSEPSDSSFNKCNAPDGSGEYWCQDTDTCKRLSSTEQYQNIALAAFVAFIITKVLIFFAECRCAKWIPRTSERASWRKCLEEGGQCMMIVFITFSLVLVIIGVVLTVRSYNTHGFPDAQMWWTNFILQLFQSSIYDFAFCIFYFLPAYLCGTYEKLDIMEDDEYFYKHPELDGKEKRTQLSPTNTNKHKSPIFNQIDSKPAERKVATGEKDVELGQKSPTNKAEPQPPRTLQRKKSSRMANQINKLTGEDTEETAPRPKINKFSLERTVKTELKKLKVKVPAVAKVGGLLKVRTPEGLKILVRIPEGVVPGVSEMMIDYAVHKRG
uniref:Uncharacterized protein n=1 Tax=Lotharella globosa TaxID=91324 RepID=A0A7S4DXQ9_9EUKA|mmetsp:Transcript_4319/g.8547  ORF Transcript_4319/g.8547 Transcript_4319/m.8547 type:complete len:599 (-) Transcript_4319:337-2133(-)|eukprot:CAMPEP_0167780542 /NCGR_PEP_ID=MMETSP0111_2-20121227/5423_1 /TAXON_ID=91324 /ORGANISM="Lotharella globosa, Strain CCCM811" /LENGTH=598 /DNA_ID=CAMNT_0007671081 /DNA_START=2 /DNA_END=1798 /DNA_ORIENTATION=+